MMDAKLQTLILCVLLYLLNEFDETAAHKTRDRFKKCLNCPPGWGVAQTCTKKADTVCQRCIAGKTYSPQYSSKNPCWLCSKCGVGLYEAHKCTPLRDTVCNECLSYIDHKNFMKPNDFEEKCSYMLLHR